jgi:aryl-alcohol dehydrogenase-like predicted oxidoreductase
MTYSELPDGTKCSALGFGCSAVMGRAGRKESLRAMGLALDAGINIFDTARSYGYGGSEGLLGEFLAGRGDEVLVSTKFGIRPSQRQTWKRMLRPAARLVLKAVPRARAAIRSQTAGQLERGDYTAAAMRKSLEESLRELRRERVDFFFLHDIQPGDMELGEVQDELFAAVAELQRAGKVRWAGVSSSLEAAAASMRLRPELNAVQMPANLFSFGEASAVARTANGRTLLANHPFGGAEGQASGRQKLLALAEGDGLPPEVREKLRTAGVASVVLGMVTRVIGAHSVFSSMIQPKHIAANVAAVEDISFSDEELRGIAGTLAQ